MRKLLIVASVLMPLAAHADFNDEADLQDMQDDFELRQMGLDNASFRMRELEYRLRELEHQQRMQDMQREIDRLNKE